jgi:hypothetical protein
MDQDNDKSDLDMKKARLEYIIPADLKSLFANQMLVQHTPSGDFFLSFYEVVPPIVLSDPDERVTQAQEILQVEARCVARIAVSEVLLPKIISSLATNFESYQEVKEILKDRAESEDKKHAS